MTAIDDYARSHWWLSAEEVTHYGIDGPDMCRDFLSFKAWTNIVRRTLTEPGWDHVLDNKWWFDLCYGRLGLALPETYGLLHPVSGMFRSGGCFREPGQLVDWLSENGVSESVLKPVYGWASTGVVVVRDVVEEPQELSFVMQNGENLSLASLWAGLEMGFRGVRGYIMQERVSTHSALRSAGLDHPYSIRVITRVDATGRPSILMAVLYLGRLGDMVNKWDAGALSIHIDTELGTLGRGRTLPQFGTAWHSSHPDTGVAFEGIMLPEWPKVRRICLDAALLTPGCRIVCWEVLLAEQGPKLIEGNLGFGLTMFQIHTTGLLKAGAFRDALQEVGADLPDGTGEWIKRHSVPRYQRYRSMLAKALRR